MPINLPDFDNMEELARRAAAAKTQIKSLEDLRDMLSATFLRMAVEDQAYWINSKPPNSTMLARVFAKVGCTKEHYQQLKQLSEQIAAAHGEYELATEKLKTCRNIIDIYRTQRADERRAHL